MRNSRRTYKNGKYGVANWENPLTRYNKLYEPFDPMKGQRKKHKKLLKFLSEAFAEREVTGDYFVSLYVLVRYKPQCLQRLHIGYCFPSKS